MTDIVSLETLAGRIAPGASIAVDNAGVSADTFWTRSLQPIRRLRS